MRVEKVASKQRGGGKEEVERGNERNYREIGWSMERGGKEGVVREGRNLG